MWSPDILNIAEFQETNAEGEIIIRVFSNELSI